DPTQDLYELSKEEAESDGPPRGTFVYELTPENNIGTPRDLTRLAQLIFEGQTPDRETSDGILDILLQQQLNDRLPRLLPTGTRVAHKTGTLSGIRNGSGVIYASDTSHIAISVFTRWDDAAVWNDA